MGASVLMEIFSICVLLLPKHMETKYSMDLLFEKYFISEKSNTDQIFFFF